VKKLVVICGAVLMTLCSSAFAGIMISGSMGTPDLSTGYFMGKATSYQYQGAESDGRTAQGVASIQVTDENNNLVVVSFYKNDLAGGQSTSTLLGQEVFVAFDKGTRKVTSFGAFVNNYPGEKKPFVSSAKIQ